MTTVLVDEVRWESHSGEWAHVEELRIGDESPGRVIDWGNSQGYANISVWVDDEDGGRRVATAPTVEEGKNWLLAIVAGASPEKEETHSCSEFTKWHQLYKELGGQEDFRIIQRFGIWMVKAGEHKYVLTKFEFCPFCGSELS